MEEIENFYLKLISTLLTQSKPFSNNILHQISTPQCKYVAIYRLSDRWKINNTTTVATTTTTTGVSWNYLPHRPLLPRNFSNWYFLCSWQAHFVWFQPFCRGLIASLVFCLVSRSIRPSVSLMSGGWSDFFKCQVN